MASVRTTFVSLALACACAAAADDEPSLRLQMPAARTLAAAALPARTAASAPAPVVPAPTPVGGDRFDLAVSNAPAAQVYLQLGAGTPYNMLVSPEVSGTISVTLKNTTLPEAMESLRELYGYDYRIAGHRIFVQPNTVQTRLFRVNYLPGRRQGVSDIRVTASSLTQAQPGSGGYGGGTTTSATATTTTTGGQPAARGDDSTHVRTSSDADFWREVQASLAALVGREGTRSVVLNPAAGVIVVRALPAELRQVDAYLRAVQLSIERQVMLEAKIVEVELSSEAQAGVNWALLGKLDRNPFTIGHVAPGASLQPRAFSDGLNTVTAGAGIAASALGKGFYGLAFESANFAALLNFLQTQGNVSVLSSPRIATLNNQKAVLKVGNDELYVTGISTTTTSGVGSTTSTPTVNLQAFFSGIALDVTPQIDDQGNVMLHVHPSISTVTEKNKNIDLGSLGSYKLPLAASTINETDSIVRVRDGQIVAIGGLMLQEQRDGSSGVPVLSDAPVIGALFRQKTTTQRKRELVILMKPTVIPDDGPWPEPNAPRPANPPSPSGG